MRNVLIIFFCSVLLCKPSQTGHSQIVSKKTIDKKEAQNAQLKKIVEKNQDEIAKLIDEIPKTKVVYVRIYIQKNVPKKKDLKNYYVITPEPIKKEIKLDDSIKASAPTIEVKAEKKPGFFYRLFHRKKTDSLNIR